MKRNKDLPTEGVVVFVIIAFAAIAAANIYTIVSWVWEAWITK